MIAIDTPTWEKLRAPAHQYSGVCARRCLPLRRRLNRFIARRGPGRVQPRVSIALRPYQEAVFADRTSGILILHWSRQIGKSFALAAWAVDRLLTRPGRLVTVLSNSRENGAEFVAKCAEVCRLNGTDYESVDKSQGVRFQNMRMEVRVQAQGKTGRIKVLAANPRTARGFSGDLILDEFAFHEDSAAIWEAAEPILASNPDFLCRIASTGNGKHNLFYRMVNGEARGAGRGALGHCRPAAGQDGRESGEDAKWGGEGNGNFTEGNAEGNVGDAETASLPSEGDRADAGGISQGQSANPARGGSGAFGVARCDDSAGRDAEARRVERDEVEEAKLKVQNAKWEREGSGNFTEGNEEGNVGDAVTASLPGEGGRAGAGVISQRPPANPAREISAALSRDAATGICRSSLGYKVSRVSRTQAHGLGVKIYDANTREEIAPEEARAQALDKRAYDQNYECAFADENMTLLTHELISAAEREDVGVICEQDWSQEFFRQFRDGGTPSLPSVRGDIYVGVDVGRNRDLTVITVMEKLGEMHLVRGILRLAQMRLPEQQVRLGEVCRLPRFRRAAIDMTGIGLGLTEYSQDEFGHGRIRGVNFAGTVPLTGNIARDGRRRETVRVTEAMATELLSIYEDRRIQHPGDGELRDDLRKPEKRTSPGGRVSIAATRDEAGHADHFWSFALALEAAGSAGGEFCYQAIARPERGVLV